MQEYWGRVKCSYCTCRPVGEHTLLACNLRYQTDSIMEWTRTHPPVDEAILLYSEQVMARPIEIVTLTQKANTAWSTKTGISHASIHVALKHG